MTLDELFEKEDFHVVKGTVCLYKDGRTYYKGLRKSNGAWVGAILIDMRASSDKIEYPVYHITGR